MRISSNHKCGHQEAALIAAGNPIIVLMRRLRISDDFTFLHTDISIKRASI